MERIDVELSRCPVGQGVPDDSPKFPGRDLSAAGAVRSRRVLFISHACVARVNQQKLDALARREGMEIALMVP